MSQGHYGICQRCSSPFSYYSWCKYCQCNQAEDQFSTWTSDVECINTLLHNVQRNSITGYDFLEWIPSRHLDIRSQIGDGGFSTVYFAKWNNVPRNILDASLEGYSKTFVAIKTFSNQFEFFKEFQAIYQWLYKFHQELSPCQRNDAIKNIHRVYGITSIDNEYAIVSAYADGGSLGDYIEKNFTNLSWSVKLGFLSDVANGLSCLHHANLTHGDLHSGNILMHRRHPLISDFGLSHEPHTSHHICGVHAYMSPEVLAGKPYTKKADIYGFGFIMYQLATGRRPFATRAHDERLTHDKISKNIRPNLSRADKTAAPPCYYNLMNECLHHNQSERPTAGYLKELFSRWHGNGRPIREFECAENKRLRLINGRNNRRNWPYWVIHNQADYNTKYLHL